MIAKDCTERLSAVALSVGLVIPRGECVSGHNVVQASFFFFFFISRIPFKIAWEDAVEGLGMAMSTEASEKNKELLFISNVFYKQ